MNNCYTECQDVKIVFIDGAGHSKMRFVNESKFKVKKVRVDGCLIKEGIRCDYMLIDHRGCEYFVELKGKQVQFACRQLEETIKKISSSVKVSKYAFVVSTACPLTNTEVQLQKIKFKNNYNAVLQIKNKDCCHHLK